MDPWLYVSLAVIVAGLLFLVNFFRRSSGAPVEAEDDVARPQIPEPVQRAGAVPRRRQTARQRMQAAHRQARQEGSDEDDIFDDIAQPEGKVGAKKLKKLEEKAARKRDREAGLQEREEKKKRDEELEKIRKKEEARIAAQEAIQEEEEKKRKEEEDKIEYEEYLKLKASFIVEEEGADAEEEIDQESLLQKFINYIKEMKVVMLEDLAAHFKMKTQDCIDRINTLQEEGYLTGVIDDRGKFIYITMDELKAISKFIKQRGRVSITDLAESSNKLVNLNPDNLEVMKSETPVAS